MNLNNEARIEILELKLETLEIKNEALKAHIEALRILNDQLRNNNPRAREISYPSTTETSTQRNGTSTTSHHHSDDNGYEPAPAKPAYTGAKRGRKPKSASQRVDLEGTLREMLREENFNQPTFRALKAVMEYLLDNGEATVTDLHEYIGGARVSIIRYTALLKKLKLIQYEGSRRLGHYVVTDKGREKFSELITK
jgi:hypothetical protein